MDSKHLVPLSNLKWLFSAAKLNNIEPAELLSVLEIMPDQFDDALVTVPADKANSAHDIIINKNANPALALITGENLPLGEFGVLDYICTSSPTIHISSSKLDKYFNILIHPNSLCKFTSNSEFACLELINHDNPPKDMQWYVDKSIEFGFSLMLTRMRTTTGYNVIPTKMYFEFSKPDYIEEYHRIFQTEIIFDAPRNLMYFDPAIPDLKQTYTEDSKLHELIKSVAESALKKMTTVTDIEEQVLQILKKEIKNGKPTINLIADKLFLSRQTLHRKLVNNDTNYSNLVDKYRKKLAQTYLRDTSLTIDDISLLLGYSNTSAFHRSFKRLTGYSPSNFRCS